MAQRSADPGEHRDSALGRPHRGTDDRGVLADGEGVELAGAACGEHGTGSVLDTLGDVLLDEIGVDSIFIIEGGDREEEDAIVDGEVRHGRTPADDRSGGWMPRRR
jgi:hypothetical protein